MSEPSSARPVTLPTGRLLAVDDQGHGLRATWHLDQGFVNLTLWRHDECVESFHLTVEDAARLTGFLVEGFTEVTKSAVQLAASEAPAPVLAVAPPPSPSPPEPPTSGTRARWAGLDTAVGRLTSRWRSRPGR